MGDEGRDVKAVTVQFRHDGDGLSRIPGRHGEGQRAGEVNGSGGFATRGDHDIVGGGDIQRHGIRGRTPLFHSQGGRGEDETGQWCNHRHGKIQRVSIGVRRVGVHIRDRIRQRHGRADADRRAGQRAVGAGIGQTIGKIAGQGIGQRPVARVGCRFRQRQRRNGGAGVVDPVGDRGRAEGRHTHGVGDRDYHRCSRGDGAIAADCMGDGRRIVGVVIVHVCRDGDGLGHVPVRGGEGQRSGDGDFLTGNGCHGDLASGRDGQDNGVGTHVTFRHGEGRAGEGDPGHRSRGRHAKGQRVGVAGHRVGVQVQHRVGQGDGPDDGGGDAGQRAGAGDKSQAVGEVAGQDVGPPVVAGGGSRQRQRRDDRLDGIRLVRHPGRAEGRHAGHVGDRDRQSGVRDTAVAGDQMVDGGRVVGGVHILAGRDGYGLRDAPGSRGEDQCAGDGDVAAGIGGRRHGHVAGRLGGQVHGVDHGRVLRHSQGGWVKGHAGHGSHDGDSEGQGGRVPG